MSKAKVEWRSVGGPFKPVKLEDETLEKVVEQAYGQSGGLVLVQGVGVLEPDSPWDAQRMRQEQHEVRLTETAAKLGGGDKAKQVAKVVDFFKPLFS